MTDSNRLAALLVLREALHPFVCGTIEGPGEPTCNRLAREIALGKAGVTLDPPMARHPFTCGLCQWGRDGAYHDKDEYDNHMAHVHPDEWAGVTLDPQPAPDTLDVERLEWRRIATHLWDLLDNIDTGEDMAKGDDAAFRRIAARQYPRRFEVGLTDGHDLWFPSIDGEREVEAESPSLRAAQEG